MPWTEDRVDLLKELWSRGYSASQIAAKMEGVTRNAVIGKVHRMGLSWRASPTKPRSDMLRSQNKKDPRPRRTAPVPPAAANTQRRVIPPSPTVPDDSRVTLTHLGRNMCKWPIGDPSKEDFHFCGAPTVSGKSYCARHMAMAFSNYQYSEDAEKPQTHAHGARKAGT